MILDSRGKSSPLVVYNEYYIIKCFFLIPDYFMNLYCVTSYRKKSVYSVPTMFKNIKIIKPNDRKKCLKSNRLLVLTRAKTTIHGYEIWLCYSAITGIGTSSSRSHSRQS